jgi:hypothetical protein
MALKVSLNTIIWEMPGNITDIDSGAIFVCVGEKAVCKAGII